MKEKIIISMLLVCILLSTGIQAEKTDIESDDIALNDIYVQAKMANADSEATIILYIWLVVNEEATTHATLRADITIDDIAIAENITVNDYTISSQTDPSELAVNYEDRAYTYEDYSQFVDGTHTVKVQFVEYENDAKASNNYKEVTFTSPNEWYGVVTNGLWSLLYTIDGVFDGAGQATGIDFLGDLPTIPILIALIVLIIIYLVYRRMKKKQGRPGRKGVQMRPSPYQANYRPPYQPPNYPY